MYRKVLWLIFSILLFVATARAEVFEHPKNLVEIVPKIPELNDIKCKFEQEKIITGSNIVLKSSGDFEFSKENGVIFKTTFPIENTTSYETSEYKQINDIVRAISNKKYEKIEAIFDFYFEQNGEVWILGLTPKKSKQVAKYLKSVEIVGSKNISKMKVTTQNSVVTSIKFF